MNTDHALIADVYKSVGSSTPFTSPLDQLSRRYGASGSSIILNDFAERSVSGLFLSSNYLDPKTAVLVAQFMELFGPGEQALIQRVGVKHERYSFVSDEEGYGLPSAEIPANIWNRKHLGIDRRYAARLSLNLAWFDALTLNFPTGHIGLTPEIEGDLKNYLIHFSTALEMARPFRLLEARFNAISAVLDKLKVGIALLTDKGSLALKNKRFDDILSQQDGVAVTQQGCLEFNSTQESERSRFFSNLKTFCSGLHSDSGQAKFTFDRKSGNAGFVASLCPLGTLISEEAEAANMAVLIVKDPLSEDQISVDVMKNLCRLTSAETEVCQMLVNGRKIDEIASRRDVSPNTARNQVASIFEKTGSNSQSQLIRFALSMDLPVENPT